MAAAVSSVHKRPLLSCGWAPFIHCHQRARFRPSPVWEDLSPVEWLTRKMELNLHMQTATWLVSRELTEAAGPWNTRLLGDDDGEYLLPRAAAERWRPVRPNGQGVLSTIRNRSLSYIGSSNAKMDAQFESMELHIKYLRSFEDSPRARAACIAYLQNWLLYFYPERPDIVTKAERLAADDRRAGFTRRRYHGSTRGSVGFSVGVSRSALIRVCRKSSGP